MDGHHHCRPPYAHATHQYRYEAHLPAMVGSSGMGCPYCLKTATVLDALFDRIHMLEMKISQAAADKEAAHQTLYRLAEAQAAGGVGGKSSPSTSTMYENSAKDTPGSSPADSLGRKAGHRFAKRAASKHEEVPLIDLFGPVEQPVKGSANASTSLTGHKNTASKVDSSDDEEDNASSPSRSREDHNAGELNVPHVHRFADKAAEPKGLKDAITHRDLSATMKELVDKMFPAPEENLPKVNLPKATWPIVNLPKSSESDFSMTEKAIVPKKEPSYSSSNDADSEGTRVHSGEESLNTSFGGSLRPFDLRQGVVESALVKNDQAASKAASVDNMTTPNYLYGLEHSMWAPRPAHASETVSPSERWSKYCENIAVKGPMCSDAELAEPLPVETPDAAIVVREGRAAKLNKFRYLDAYNLCFNPGEAELGVYRTIIITKLPASCTMTDVLGQIRGGTILDAKMLDTSTITKSWSAMLTFVEGNNAMDLEEHAKTVPILIAGHKVAVSLVEVPTRPMALGLRQGIEKHNQTRCLHVRGFPRQITPQSLRNDLRPDKATKLDYVESMVMNADGILELRFLSIAAAQHARELLVSKGRKYGNCQIMYGPDPCAQAWCEAQKSPMQAEEKLTNKAEEEMTNEAGKEQDTLHKSKPGSETGKADSGLSAEAAGVEKTKADDVKQEEVQQDKLTVNVISTVTIEGTRSLGFDWW